MNASLGPISHEQLVSLCMGDEVDIIMDSDMVDERAIEVRDEVNCSFLCDSMLGRPHRWLRCLGIDSVFIGADVSRADVLSLAAKSEGRIFLTRDIKLASRREISHKSCFVLSSQSPEEQLREISRAFGIDFQESEVLSRCPSCGAKAFQEAERESVRDRVSGTVMESISQFFECGVCFQVFWMGPKSEKAIENVKRILCGSSSAEDSLNTLKEEGMVRPEKVLLIN